MMKTIMTLPTFIQDDSLPEQHNLETFMEGSSALL